MHCPCLGYHPEGEGAVVLFADMSSVLLCCSLLQASLMDSQLAAFSASSLQLVRLRGGTVHVWLRMALPGPYVRSTSQNAPADAGKPVRFLVLARRIGLDVDGDRAVAGGAKSGCVGTRCFVVLLKGRDETDPFFLQIKEAGRSVLEGHLPDSKYDQQGRRVVEGQRLMQATSDSFLGWHVGGHSSAHYYWRQFKDMKGSFEVEGQPVEAARRYARLCGWTLARAHARSGDTAAIAGYLGSGDNFDAAIADFSVAYADQNERDYAAFKDAIDTGRIAAHE